MEKVVVMTSVPNIERIKMVSQPENVSLVKDVKTEKVYYTDGCTFISSEFDCNGASLETRTTEAKLTEVYNNKNNKRLQLTSYNCGLKSLFKLYDPLSRKEIWFVNPDLLISRKEGCIEVNTIFEYSNMFNVFNSMKKRLYKTVSYEVTKIPDDVELVNTSYVLLFKNGNQLRVPIYDKYKDLSKLSCDNKYEYKIVVDDLKAQGICATKHSMNKAYEKGSTKKLVDKIKVYVYKSTDIYDDAVYYKAVNSTEIFMYKNIDYSKEYADTIKDNYRLVDNFDVFSILPALNTEAVQEAIKAIEKRNAEGDFMYD